MKNICILLLLFITGMVSAQEIPEPEYSMRPYYLDNEKLITFEKVKAELDMKVKGLGYGGYVSYLTAFEKSSSVRFTTNDIPRIFILIEGKVDPEDIVSVFRQTKRKRKKDRRRFKHSSRALGGKVRDVSDNQIPYEIKRVRDNIFEISFDKVLEPDEYAIVAVAASDNQNPFALGSTTQKIYCFGID
jgi:hypothetical protein